MRAPKHHRLKTWSKYFQEVAAGNKKFEVRENDRDFQVGDFVTLIEFEDGKPGESFGPVEIDFILPGGRFGIPEDYVVFNWKTP